MPSLFTELDSEKNTWSAILSDFELNQASGVVRETSSQSLISVVISVSL